MSTQVMRGLSKKIQSLKSSLSESNLSERERRWYEFKLVEAEFWLWVEQQGYIERRQAERHNG